MNKKFVIGGIITALITMAGSLIAPTEVRYLNTLTDNSTLVGLTFGVGSLFLAIFSLYIGKLSDRFGREKFILAGLLFGIVYPLLYASTYNIFSYMGVRFVWAFSAAATGPVFMAYLQDLLINNKKKGVYLGYLFSVQAICGSIGALIGGFISSKFGLIAPYYCLSLVLLIAFLITFIHLYLNNFGHKKEIKEEKKEEINISKIDSKNKNLFFSIYYIFSKPILLFYFLFDISYKLNWGTKNMIWPLIIYSISQNDAITGSVFATMGGVAFIALPFTGRFVDHYGPRKSLLISAFILGSFGLVLVFSQTLWIFWLAAGLYAIGEAFHGSTAGVIMVDNIESRYRVEILGFKTAFDKILTTISPFLAGIFLTYFSLQEVLFFFILLFWITFVGLIFLDKLLFARKYHKI
jgi:MFS family permease